MMEAYNSPKFKKAETPAAIAVMNKTRALIEEWIDKCTKMLA
jgi:hypothetical protein